jgi:hypothetical protein
MPTTSSPIHTLSKDHATCGFSLADNFPIRCIR